MRIYFSTLKQNHIGIIGTVRTNRNTSIAQSDCGRSVEFPRQILCTTVREIIKSYYII